MAKSRETLRVGLPIRALTLRALLDAADPGLEATARYSRGSLIIEEPQPTLDGVARPLVGSHTDDA